MFPSQSLRKLKDNFFSRKSLKSKLNKDPSGGDKQRPRSASICSVQMPPVIDLVEESLSRGLPIIPFAFPTFVISEEESDYNELALSDYVPDRIVNMNILMSRKPLRTPTDSFKKRGIRGKASLVDGRTRSLDPARSVLGSVELRLFGQTKKTYDGLLNFNDMEEKMFLDFSKNLKPRKRAKLDKVTTIWSKMWYIDNILFIVPRCKIKLRSGYDWYTSPS